MTDNSELEAAILGGIGSEYNTPIENACEALKIYSERFHALEADNERTNRDRSALCIDFALLTEENARLRAALLPFAQTWAAYQRDYNSDRDKAAFYATVNNDINWFSIWMHHDGYKLAQEADYQQAAAMTADVEASSTTTADVAPSTTQAGDLLVKCDEWIIVHGGGHYIHLIYYTEADAVAELARIREQQPTTDAKIVRVEGAWVNGSHVKVYNGVFMPL